MSGGRNHQISYPASVFSSIGQRRCNDLTTVLSFWLGAEYFRRMDIEFEGTVWEWRGPAPHYFVTVPTELCSGLRAAAKLISYGWGMVPATIRVGNTEWRTAIFPKDGGYIVPLRADVRRAEGIEGGHVVRLNLLLGP